MITGRAFSIIRTCGGGRRPIKRERACLSHLVVVKMAILVTLWVLNLKRTTTENFRVPFKCIESKKYDCHRRCVGLEFLPLRGEKKISTHTYKTGTWCLLGFFFQNF